MIDIRLPADILFMIGPVPVRNGHVAAFLMTLAFSLFALWFSGRIKLVPGRIQTALELITEFLMDQLENAFQDRDRAKKFFPLMMTALLFILIANQFSLIPLVSSIVAGDVPALRSPTSDLAMTLALALFVVVLANVLALSIAPLHHIGSFIRIVPILKARSLAQFGRALFDFLLGLLDIISEFAKVLSLSGRLFGNIFAGEVMVAVIAGLSVYTQFLAPIPFIFLAMFSGLIQAFVFVLLSTQFIAGSVNSALESRKEAVLSHS
ncbi:F0F1 ATP synthase subunit A [Candidatus Uhrbacteria bacterium]|nr:MAG: F0F1 ATP synthase subunit A [Candidatus Uhrbacteria bacterium]